MSRICFTSATIPSVIVGKALITSIAKEGDDTIITLSSYPDTPINLGSVDEDVVGIKKDGQVSLEPLTHPANTFILSMIEKKAKASKTEKSTTSSPMSRDQFSNRLD